MATTTQPPIGDASEWPAEYKELQEIDALMRCPICYEYISTALVIPQCSHTYCSLCIRRYIGYKTQCPTCKGNVAETDLRSNRIVDELIKCFKAVRLRLLQLVLVTGSTGPAQTQDASRVGPSSVPTQSSRSACNIPARKASRKRTTRPLPKGCSESDSEGSDDTEAYCDSDRDSDIEICDRSPSPELGSKRRLQKNTSNVCVLPPTTTLTNLTPSRIPSLTFVDTSNAKPSPVPSATVTSKSNFSSSTTFTSRPTPVFGPGLVSESDGSSPKPQNHELPVVNNKPTAGGDGMSAPPDFKSPTLAVGRSPFSSRTNSAPPPPWPSVVTPTRVGAYRNPSPPATPGTPSMTASQSTASPSVARVDCPVCGVSIPERNVNLHLDRCLRNIEMKTSQPSPSQRRKPMPKLVYSIMKDKELKRKLSDSNLPTDGDRKAMIKRHHEFTLQYNSQCDTVNPMSNKEIIREMTRADRCKALVAVTKTTNALQIDKGASASAVETAQHAYVKKHKDQFAELIADVRHRNKLKKEEQQREAATKQEQLKSSVTNVQQGEPCHTVEQLNSSVSNEQQREAASKTEQLTSSVSNEHQREANRTVEEQEVITEAEPRIQQKVTQQKEDVQEEELPCPWTSFENQDQLNPDNVVQNSNHNSKADIYKDADSSGTRMESCAFSGVTEDSGRQSPLLTAVGQSPLSTAELTDKAVGGHVRAVDFEQEHAKGSNSLCVRDNLLSGVTLSTSQVCTARIEKEVSVSENHIGIGGFPKRDSGQSISQESSRFQHSAAGLPNVSSDFDLFANIIDDSDDDCSPCSDLPLTQASGASSGPHIEFSVVSDDSIGLPPLQKIEPLKTITMATVAISSILPPLLLPEAETSGVSEPQANGNSGKNENGEETPGENTEMDSCNQATPTAVAETPEKQQESGQVPVDDNLSRPFSRSQKRKRDAAAMSVSQNVATPTNSSNDSPDAATQPVKKKRGRPARRASQATEAPAPAAAAVTVIPDGFPVEFLDGLNTRVTRSRKTKS